VKAGGGGCRCLRWGGILAAVTLPSCDGPTLTPDQPGPWALEHDLEIGSIDGRDGGATFGQVTELVPFPDGGVIVVDFPGPRVSRYSADGRFLHQLGGVGDGPGEYRDVSGTALMSDGTVMVRDPQRALMFFGPDGALVDEWPVRVDYVGADPVAVAGDTILLRLTRRGAGLEDYWETPVYGFARATAGNVIDTVTPVPEYGSHDLHWAPYYPTYHIAWSADGSMIHGAGSRYHIAVVNGRADTVALLQKDTERIPAPAWMVASISEHRQWLERRGSRAAPFYPPPLSVLPVFDGILVSSRDEVWVRRPVGSIDEGLAHRMDVWDQSGKELGWLDVPPRTEIRSVVGDSVWGIRRGNFDEEYVVRYRLVRGPPPSS
jgi:hypothetical protein